jgi:hypothetical protein
MGLIRSHDPPSPSKSYRADLTIWQFRFMPLNRETTGEHPLCCRCAITVGIRSRPELAIALRF